MIELQRVDDYVEGCIPPGTKVAAEPKLDGWRLKATRDGLFTRGCERLDLLHIFEDLGAVLLPVAVFYDGELTHPDGFQAIKTAIAAKDERLRYNVFDLKIGTEWPYFDRQRHFGGYFKKVDFKYCKHVPSQIIDVSEIPRVHAKHLAAGCEGTVIKLLDRPYESGKTGSWFRIVPTMTMDCKVVGVNASKTIEGAISSVDVEDAKGVKSKVKGFSRDMAYEIFAHPRIVMNKFMECTYKSLTKAGRMRSANYSRMRPDKEVFV